MRSIIATGASKGFFAALLCALGLSTAVSAQTLTVTGINTDNGKGLVVTVPSVEITGSTVTEADVRGMFGGNFELAVKTLSTLDAQSVSIPEITIVYTGPGENGVSVNSLTKYSDIVFTDVVDGVAKSTKIGETVASSTTSPGPSGKPVDTSVTFGAMTTGLLDIGGMLGFYGLGDKAGDTSMKPIYKDFAFEGMTLTSDEVSCTFGAARAAEFSARPLSVSFTEIMDLSAQLQAAGQNNNPPPEAIAKLLDFYVDIFTAFQSSPMTFDGLSCDGKDERGKEMKFTSGPMTIDGFSPGFYPKVSVDRFRVDVAEEGWLEFGNFTWKAMDLAAPIAALESLETFDPAWFAENWRMLIPGIEGFSISDFSMDVPMEGSPGERTILSMDAFDLTLADYVNGIPSNIVSSTDALVVQLPNTKEAAIFRDAGMDKLNLGYDLGLRWDQAAGTIVIDQARLLGADLGEITISGVLGNATENLFSTNPAIATQTAMGLTAKEVKIHFNNQGVLDLILATAAKEQSQDPAAFRIIMAGMAQAMPMGVLGASPDAIAVGNALRQFIEGTPELTLTLTAKKPEGLSLMELQKFSQNPAGLNEVVAVTAVASGTPRTTTPTTPATTTTAPASDAKNNAHMNPVTGPTQGQTDAAPAN